MSNYAERVDDSLPDTAPKIYPFRPLGYDAGNFYFLPANRLQVTAISAPGMGSKANLLAIAPLEWWESQFSSKQGCDWTMAANACMRWCEEAGVFDPAMVRGRGAWYDQGSSVLHLGKRLVVDGEHKLLQEHATPYIYEQSAPLELNGASEAATTAEARRLRDVTDSLCWERPISAVLVAGWAYLAPVCGALRWRPHLWVTGQRGTGKSYVIDQIIRPVVGTSAVVVQSTSTEAGIRQTMGHDARPILFDEAEAETRQAQGRVQSVLELARQASSENSAEIAKGTSSGKAMTFRVRSMFLLGSINVTLAQAADVTRFTVCQLAKPPKGIEGTEQFDRLQALVKDVLTEDFGQRLRARAYQSIPVIRENARVLSRAVAEHLGDQRIGDQIGTLLAGAYSLKQDGTISLEQARKLVRSLDWSDSEQQHEEASDQDRLVNELMAKRVRVEGDRVTVERTVAELISATQGQYVEGVTSRDATATLERCGFKVSGRNIRIANTHPWIRSSLSDTPWGAGWRQILSYLDGAKAVQPTWFAGQTLRCIELPVASLLPALEGS